MTGEKREDVGVSREVMIRHLRQLVEALERRVPHIERSGEAAIARDAAVLKEKALKRIAELESERKRTSH
jgi:hypothetical protein